MRLSGFSRIMSENMQIVFRLPNRSGWRGADGTADFVDAVGAVFETVHTLFDREPEQYAPLSAGAVYVPLSALETAYRQDKPVGGLEDMLFANLEYPFPQAAFDAYLSDGTPLTSYTESIAPGGSFWCAAAQSARQEEFDRLMEAVHRMLAVTDCDSEETVETLCRTCSLARMRRYCETADSKQTVCDRFAGCYDAAMAGSGESIAPEERAFLRSALVLYSLWEVCGEDGPAAAADIPMPMILTAQDFSAMMQDADNRAAMEDLFACTETAAGGFWRTLYAAAEQAGDDALVAETAACLEALLRLLCGDSDVLTRHRERLFALVG